MEKITYTLEEYKLLQEENEILKSKIADLEYKLREKNSRGAGRKNISKEIQAEIYTKFQNGIKVSVLSEEYGLSAATIYSIVKKIPKEEISSADNQNETGNIFDFLNSDFFT